MFKNIRGKRLLVLGGMRISCEIVKKAKEMGLFVAVTDYNEPENSPAKQIADASYMVSTTDVDAVANLIRNEKMDGVIVGFNDLLLPYYADICKITGLPCYGTKKQFELFTDKRAYKSVCRKYGVPTIKEYDKSYLSNKEAMKLMDFPVIVKPSSSSGARGITICYDADSLSDAYVKAERASVDGDVIIEQYLDEKEATVFWVFQDGNYYLSMIGNRHVKHNQEGVIPLPAGYSYPSSLTDRYIENVVPKAKKMFKEVGIKDGMMFMQCKVSNGECLVYDIGYRLTGSLEYKNLKDTCGFDPLEMMIYFAVTGKMAEDSIESKVNPYLGKYAFNISRLCKPGTIKEIKGCDAVINEKGVSDVVIAHLPGETITENMKGLLAQITVRILGIADNFDELKEKMLNVQKQIQIISKEGDNLALDGIEEDDLENCLCIIQNR